MVFQFLPQSKQAFEPYFQMSDAPLADHRARRVTADAFPGFPCRVSPEDAAPGEVPKPIQRRLISARVFDVADDLIASHVMPGKEAGDWIEEAFNDPRAKEEYLHHARYGSFAAKAERA